MRWLPFLAAVTLLAGCGAGSNPVTTVERSDSAGVSIVLSRGADHPLATEFTATLTLGGADDGPESFFQLGWSSVATDSAGHIYILDNGNHRVLVFDDTGSHLRTLGRKGGGPGEFQFWPRGLRLGPDGSINVYDFGKQGLVRFAADGEILPSRTIETPLPGGEYAFSDRGLVVRTQVVAEGGTQAFDVLAAIAENGDTTVLTSFEPGTAKPIDFGCVRIGGMQPIFTPRLAWVGGAAGVMVNAGSEYRIDVFEGGRATASYRRDLALRPASHEMALRQVGDNMKVSFGNGGSCVIQANEVVDKRGFADVLPSIDALARAPDGAIWVRRFAVTGDDAIIDLLGPDGAYLGTLPAGSPFPAAFMPDGRIVAIDEDELGVQRVVVYRSTGDLMTRDMADRR